jgi:hypothetical protein
LIAPRSRSLKGPSLAVIIGLCMLAACSDEDVNGLVPIEETDETCQAMFVQSAQGMLFDGARLTLEGMSPSIIYFCDRPVREAGHLTWDALLELGGGGNDSFEVNEPNAAVSVFGPDGEVVEAVVMLTAKPSMSEDRAIFPVELLDGDLPTAGGATILFIDPIGRPRSPTSVAGAHRRHRHRAVRRH